MKYFIVQLFVLIGFASTVNAAELQPGVPATGLTAATDQILNYEIAIPTGASNLSISIEGGSGDADLYVRAGSTPSLTSYDCRPYLTGNNESCEFATPLNTTYFIQLRAYQSFSGVSLLATYTSPNNDTNPQDLTNGHVLSNLSAAADSENTYVINVPTAATNLTITVNGGTGDSDLYVRFGNIPTTSSYDCRPYLSGNNETCQFANPQTGSYYIMLRAYSAYSGISLTATYSTGSSGGGGATWSGFSSYYSAAIGQTGISLITALQEAAARNQNVMAYSQVWEALKYTDEDPSNSNNVLLLYTGRSQAKTFNSSGNNDPDAWNREHTWPKSHGFPSAGDWAYTDIHHLRPSDASVNASRSNKDFDTGGSTISEAPGNFTDADSFEPRNQIKGDIARMMFYMDIRYDGGSATGTDDLQLVDYTQTSGATLGKLCTLYLWHQQDPVSAEEIARHARIVERQGNRNPFVDYPAWVEDVWGPYCE